MMRYKVLISIQVLFFLIINCSCVGISPKLDFGESPSSSKLIGTATHYRTVVGPHSHLKREEKESEDLCVGGCNKTDDSKDSIQTEVEVRVKTTVDVNKNKTNYVDDTPDIPVIVGTAGTNYDNSQSRTLQQSPLVLTDFGDTFSSPVSPLGPSVSSPITPSFVSSYPSYNTPSIHSDSVYLQKSNLPAEPRVDVKIKTLPPVTVTLEDGQNIKDIRYKSNGIELRVPYFEPSYHNHYFGEDPPPQLVWYPKKPTSTHSVDYNRKATWKPSFWQSGTPHHHSVDTGNNCPCKTQVTGLQWHPSRRVYEADPGRQIDDKLAPLN